VNTPFTTSWNPSTMTYDVQNTLRRSNDVRSTARSSNADAATPTTAATV
jgi:hypothetical protein